MYREIGGELIQWKPLYPLHDDGRRFGFIEYGVDGHDGGIGKPSRFACLIQHPAAQSLACVAVEDLDGYATLQFFIKGCVNRTQATASQTMFDTEAGERGQRIRVLNPGWEMRRRGGSFSFRAQEITGFIVGSKQRIDFLTELGVASALLRYKALAFRARLEFERTREYRLDLTRAFFHIRFFGC